MRIACIGEAMIEMVTDAAATSADLGVAGDSMNTAIYLRRDLAAEHEVAYVTMVGRDRLSDRIVDFIASEGVSTDLIVRHPDRLPGLYLISTSEDGERAFSYWRNSSAARAMFTASTGIDFGKLDGFDIVFASAISLAILPPEDRDRFFAWIGGFRSRGGRFVFDSNYRPALWPDVETARGIVERAWRCCDIGLPSLDDEMALFGDADEEAVLVRLRSCGISDGLMKRGQLGPRAIASGAPLGPFRKVTNVVDTTAAGDSFNGGFLAAYLTGANLAVAARMGHDLASHVVTKRGAIVPSG